MSISMKELLGSHNINDVPIAHQHNLEELKKRINVVRNAWGKPMIVTSGYRSEADQMRINKNAPNSAHRFGMAVDISDPDGKFYEWLVNNEKLLIELDLYVEIRQGPWAHVQTRKTKSGKRFFQP